MAAPANKISLDNKAISDKQIAETKSLYGELLSFQGQSDEHILHSNEEQLNLWRVLTAGRLNGYPRLLSHLFHDYLRHRKEMKFSTKSFPDTAQWSKSSNLVQLLFAPKDYNSVKQAVDTLQARLGCKAHTFTKPNENQAIDGRICDLVEGINRCLSHFKNGVNWEAPSQLDIWFVPELFKADAPNDDIKNDEDSDSDESEEEEDDESENEIEEQFSETNLYEHIILTDKDHQWKDGSRLKQCINERLKFCARSNPQKTSRRLRLCAVILNGPPPDPKKLNGLNVKNDNDEKEMDSQQVDQQDEQIQCRPIQYFAFRPQIHHRMPEVAGVDLGIWGMQASLTDFLPKMGLKSPINARNCGAAKDRMFMLSLQKIEDTQIVALLYHNGFIHRFDPSDAMDVLKRMFVENEENDLSKNEEQRKFIEGLINDEQMRIPDEEFEGLRKNGMKYQKANIAQ